MGAQDPPATADGVEPRGRSSRLHAATLYCENCDEETPHRILRMAEVKPGPHAHLSGTARCRRCELTHRFDIVPPPAVEVAVVVSDGPRSSPRRLRVPANVRIELGGHLPANEEHLEVKRIETHSGRSISSGRPKEISTLWVTKDVGAVVAISVVEGARTWAERLTLPRETRLTVGDQITVRGQPLRIVGLRARGRTWRLPEDGFDADEVQRVYARRTDSPPAGRRTWSAGRESPRSRTSATSTAERSRSSPGVRRARTFPRARSAEGGAAIHRTAP